ncbi:hypothetical protein A9K55_001146 [Cordyceps militaris]|uniref:Uncharacterized protein n=1 Tax=Cordyceps militaris TaxID=73501 RepID=A0A2H4SV22_CORMI|nr:hypothetical protein A9K55_001146 [Cordyceps militaris]
MDHVILDSAINLQIPNIRSQWFEECLLRLSDLVPDLWNCWCRWVMLTHKELDMPHASCFVLDSGTPDENAILLSEAEAAAALVKHQLRNGIYTSHHTKPVLLATVMRNQTGRITQGHFDGKQNKLVLRQSRTMDLSGEKPSNDAWTMLRWIASQPVGQTRYEIGDTEEGACGNNNPVHDVSFTPKYHQNQDPRQREALVPEVGTGSGYPSRC